MAVTIDGTSGINTPGVVNTAAETIATTLTVTGVTTVQAGTAALPAIVSTTGTTDTGLWFPAADTVAVSTGGTERARIDSSGNLLVGATTNPHTALLYLSKSGADWKLAISDTNVGAQSFITFRYGTTSIGSITGNNTATAYATSSDYRLKEAIAPMTGALAKVALLKPCTYKWKVDGSDGQGFIAHELDEVVPGCVTGAKDAVDKDGNPEYQGIDTSFLVATLTAAIQEQQATITALTARITALEQA